jgi:hypothetical protein
MEAGEREKDFHHGTGGKRRTGCKAAGVRAVGARR